MPAAPGTVPLHSHLAGLPEPTCFVPPIDARSSQRFGVIFLLTALVLALVWPVFSLLWLNHYDDAQVGLIGGLYSRKHVAAERAAAKGEPRLFVVGGSGSLAGIDAELIELKLGIPTVNLAAHAGLGTEYLLYRARQEVKPGDVVLLSPEYQLWLYPPEELTDLGWQYAVTYDKGFFLDLPRGRVLQMMYSVPLGEYYAAGRGWRKRVAGKHHRTRPVYDAGSLSPNGDLRMPLPRENFPRPTHFPFPDVASDSGSVRHFRAFAGWAKANNVRVYFTWPNMARPEPPPAPPGDAPPAAMLAQLRDWGFTTLDAPTDNTYPAEWFTDTSYHPDAGCRRVRTEAIIRNLRPHFGMAEKASAATGIYLVGAGAHVPAIENAFLNMPGVQVKYLSAQPVKHPDAITPAELAQLHGGDFPVYADDPELVTSIERQGWRGSDWLVTPIRFADWTRIYDHHLFLVAGPWGAAVPSDLPPPADARSLFAAVFGTGRWASVRRVDPSRIETDLRSLVRADVPQLLLESRALPDGRSAVLVNRAERAAGAGVAVAVIDVEMGIVVAAATFPADGSPVVTRRLRRLTRAL